MFFLQTLYLAHLTILCPSSHKPRNRLGANFVLTPASATLQFARYWKIEIGQPVPFFARFTFLFPLRLCVRSCVIGARVRAHLSVCLCVFVCLFCCDVCNGNGRERALTTESRGVLSSRWLCVRDWRNWFVRCERRVPSINAGGSQRITHCQVDTAFPSDTLEANFAESRYGPVPRPVNSALSASTLARF